MMIKIVHDNQTNVKSFCFLYHADFSLYQGRDCESTILRMELILSDWTSVGRAEQFSRASCRTSPPSCPPITNKGACEGKKGRRRMERTSAACLSTVRSLSLSLCCCIPSGVPTCICLSLPESLCPENNTHVVVILPQHTCIMMWHFIPVKSRLKSSAYFLSFWNISHQNSLCHAKKVNKGGKKKYCVKKKLSC